MAGQTPSLRGTEYMPNMTSWQLFATNMAFSRPHIDAGGLATWVTILRGWKIWMVSTEPLALYSDTPLTELSINDWKQKRWLAFILREGDTL